MSVKSARHGGDIFGLAEEERNQIIDFSININPLGLSPKGREALSRSWEKETLRYPDVECRDLVKQLSKRYDMPENTIALGNGATELMYKLLELLRPKKVLVMAPSFSEYRLSAEAAGSPVESILLEKKNGFALPVETIRKKLTHHSLLYLGHPNNPDGQLLVKEDLLSLLKAVKETDSFLLIDESFIDFLGDGYSYRQLFRDISYGAVVMSLTKFYAVPGLRIGCAFLAPKLCETLKSTLIPWNVNGLAQLYMTAALQDDAYREDTIRYNQEERAFFAGELGKIQDIEILPGCVNFILCRLKGTFQTAADLQKALSPYGFFLRQCGNYEGLDDTYFRLAVRTKEENRTLLHAMQEVFSK